MIVNVFYTLFILYMFRILTTLTSQSSTIYVSASTIHLLGFYYTTRFLFDSPKETKSTNLLSLTKNRPKICFQRKTNAP